MFVLCIVNGNSIIWLAFEETYGRVREEVEEVDMAKLKSTIRQKVDEWNF